MTRATQRDPQKIAAWLEQDYPSIAARAKREKAAIYWSDETGVCNQDQIGLGYAPKGQTPVLRDLGEVKRALSVFKKRRGAHERTIRDIEFSSRGIEIGPPLRQFRGILTGVPEFQSVSE